MTRDHHVSPTVTAILRTIHTYRHQASGNETHNEADRHHDELNVHGALPMIPRHTP